MRALFLLLMIGTLAAATDPHDQVVVPPRVKSLLSPILELWREQTKCEALANPQVNPRPCAQLQDQVGAQILELSVKKGMASDEAMAAILNFGIPEDLYAHDFICLAASRGKKMIPALGKYRSCNLDISAGYPDAMRSNQAACQRAIDKAITMIQENSADKICTWD